MATESKFPEGLSYGHLTPEETQDILMNYPHQGEGEGFSWNRIQEILHTASEAKRLKGELGEHTPEQERARREQESREDAEASEEIIFKKGDRPGFEIEGRHSVGRGEPTQLTGETYESISSGGLKAEEMRAFKEMAAQAERLKEANQAYERAQRARREAEYLK